MSSLKLGVVVVSAHDLVPKDGHGAANPCVELHFDGQTFRTTVKEKDVNPVWNEIFYFNVTDSSALQDKPLEAVVYHVDRASRNKAFLGRVKLPGSSFFSHADAAGEALAYPLEKYGLKVFSRVRGELSLKLFITDDPSIRASTAPVDPVQSFFNVSREEQPRQPPQYYSRATATVGSDPAFRGVTAMAGVDTRWIPPPFGQQTADRVKETSPSLGGGRVVGGRVIPEGTHAGAFDLVEKMEYLFVRVVKARDLPAMDITGSLDPYVEVKLGNYKGETKYFEKNQNPEWNEVFSFSKDRLQATVVDVVVKDKDIGRDDFVGRVRFELNEVPKRVPPDSPLAPEWYRLEDKKGDKVKGELMLAVWHGTQADECFAYATHYENLKGAGFSGLNNQHRAKVYHAPRIWYLRVEVIAAQDVYSKDRSKHPNVQCRVQLGRQMYKTSAIRSPTSYYVWNNEFIFVAAEPFEEQLLLSVEDQVGPNKDEVIGQVHLPLSQIEKRHDDRKVREKWHDLKKEVTIDVDQLKEDKFASKIQVRASLDGGYHVLHEPTHYSSDLRPTAKQLWKSHPIGLLELGILKADRLHPTKTRDGKGTCDAYCVAKYGQKWVRTRTVVDDPNPKFQEQYTWDVYDHGTVLTIGVFDNHNLDEKGSGSSHGNRDAIIGKVRIRLSTLHTGRVYSHTYPLLVLLPSGVKNMGELHLAIRFSTTSMIEAMYLYSKPLLPKMHYTKPMNPLDQERLRHIAVQIVADRLSRMEPPLRREVVEYMSDAETHLWSMRRSKANYFRLVNVFAGPMAIWKWFQGVCNWNNPMTTVLVHILFVMLVCFPELIFPTVFLYMFLIGVWHYRFRLLHPPHMDIKLSQADSSSPDDLDEEFDRFPTTQTPDIIRMRYDKLRHLAGKMQTIIGNIATQGERLQLLLTWRDPRATAMFMVFCLLAALVFYATPIQVVIFLGGFYLMRHPKFRHKTPSWAMNFFRRLPTRADSLI